MKQAKHWVLIRKNTGQVAAWRDYGDVAWGSPMYTVLGYHEGSYRDALRAAHSLLELELFLDEKPETRP